MDNTFRAHRMNADTPKILMNIWSKYNLCLHAWLVFTDQVMSVTYIHYIPQRSPRIILDYKLKGT